MARKWSNLNIPGALHYVTGNCVNRLPVFTEATCCQVFLEQLEQLDSEWPAKLIVYVLMPDHFHFISNPEDGRIIEFCGELKSKAAKAIIDVSRRFHFPLNEDGRQVWQESFKAIPLEWLDDQAKDQLHSCQSCESKAGAVSSRLLLVELSILL